MTQIRARLQMSEVLPVYEGIPSPESFPASYRKFEQLDGSHPWQQAVPKGYVLYPVRQLPNGKVTYFNYSLAKEMGLISKNHPHQLNADLENVLLKTFALQIINEYDQINRRRFEKKLIKQRWFMATRYLQLQHENKRGKTSGDGRGIWNGIVTNQNKTWDVSSRGTGVTCFAPGAVQAGRPLKTGNNDFGYGCGLAELDELYSSAVMSEVFHHQDVPTERMLAIIDLGKGLGIGVRASPNLLRPAHFLLYLKQGDHESLRQSLDYFIDRQFRNKRFPVSSQHASRYDHFMTEFMSSFARFTAQLERNYIFAWLDWDGDNVLTDAGIIDYGSIRQFGLRHDQYRYDDVDRFSTNLNEQKLKARVTVQQVIQAVDFLKSGKKKPLQTFERHPFLKKFDQIFQDENLFLFLLSIGFQKSQAQKLMKNHRKQVEKLEQSYKKLEVLKTRKQLHKVADGVDRPAILNMRLFLHNAPEFLLRLKAVPKDATLKNQLGTLLSKAATKRDRDYAKKQLPYFKQLCRRYLVFLRLAVEELPGFDIKEFQSVAQFNNRQDRLTGNSVTLLTDELVESIKKGLRPHEIQKTIESVIGWYQEGSASQITPSQSRSVKLLLRKIQQIILEYREGI